MEPTPYQERPPYHYNPNVVKIGARIIYKGNDAADWLKRQKDRNIKATAKLFFS